MRASRARRIGPAVAAGLALGLVPLAIRAGPPPACIATADVSPQEAFVGQQLVYRVRILSREEVRDVDWVAPERIPGFRVEWLGDRTDSEPQVLAHTSYRVREERRALFPERSGEHTIAATSVRCRLAADAAEQTLEVPIPALQLEVREPPVQGRPPDWKELVGRISLQSIASPSEIRLGESVRLAFMVRGSGNVWDLEDPLGPVAGAEVFARRPALRLETGRPLRVVKHFSYDIVPLHPGEFVVPGVRLTYFDPASESYATAVSESLRIQIHPRTVALQAPRPRDAAEAADPAASPEPAVSAGSGARWRLVVVALAGAAVGFALLRQRHSRAARGPGLAAMLADLPPDENATAVYASALRASLGRRIDSIRSLSAEEIGALPDLPPPVAEAARLLLDVERARFDPNAPVPSREAVERVLSQL